MNPYLKNIICEISLKIEFTQNLNWKSIDNILSSFYCRYHLPKITSSKDLRKQDKVKLKLMIKLKV